MPVITGAELAEQLGPFSSIQAIGPQQTGSGECWRVVRGTDEHVIKVIAQELDPGRFQRELQALGSITSQHVMKAIGNGEVVGSNGQRYPYLEAEFIPGGNVADNLASSGIPSDEDLRAFLVGALE